MSVTPVLQYGSLDMDFYADLTGTGVAPTHEAAGVSQDLAFGYNLGVSYVIAGITMGATYVSQIDMEYTGQFVEKLSTPGTMGIGASYKMNEHTIALDYKVINWEDADGYKDFGWKNQDVIAVGYEYAANGWAARLGYNYAASPIEDTNFATDGGMTNMFNLVGFPAIIESHITIGGSYDLSEKAAIDLAYVYAPEASETFNVMTPGGPSTITTTHSQTSLTAQVTFKY